MTDELMSVVADARAALGSASEVSGPAGEAPRFELFHAATSICSHKVRTVLAHHALPYVSHPVNMFMGQSYLPEYVRLRMIGCERFGGALVSHHSGSTSASVSGCDGAVVPTLVDWRTDEVIVDSKAICLYLDAQVPEASRLRPAELAAAIDGQLAIVDDLPNYQMLMGRTPSASEASATRTDTGGTFSRRKVAWCERYLEERAGDPVLVRAYTAADRLFSAEAMRAAYEHAEAAVRELERALGRNDRDWLYGEAVTMADLFWGIELLRMKNVGASTFWEGGKLPRVERFEAAIEALPAIRTAICEWPGAVF